MSIAKKKFSRKNKSSWRKYVNIKDVEDFLENKRQEERIGSVNEKNDEELFTLDTGSNENVLTSKRKRRINALKPPKNISILENTSKVQDPLVQRNRVKLKRNGRDLFEEVIDPSKSKRGLRANVDRKKYYDKLDKKISRRMEGKSFHDIWEEDQDPDRKQFLNNEWINKGLALYNLRNIGKAVVKVHESAHHKTCRVKEFESPHPGTSYNPSLKDHQNLLLKVVEKEDRIIKEEKHLKRVTTNMFSKVSVEQRDSAWRVEMSSELAEEGNPSAQAEQCSEDIDCSVNPPVQNKKKDRKTRRKQKEQRQLQLKIQEKKEQKKKVTDLHKLRHITQEVSKEMDLLEKARKRRRTLKEKRKFEPKRISKVKYQEPEIDINMAEDIAGNLRNVKTESSLLVDRFKDLQKRNILPPNVDLGPRKRRKIKRFVRSSHKETGNTTLLNEI